MQSCSTCWYQAIKWCSGAALNVNYLDNKYPDVDDGPEPWSAPDVSIIGWCPALVITLCTPGHAIKAPSPVSIIKILPPTRNGNILSGYLAFYPAWSNIYPSEAWDVRPGLHTDECSLWCYHWLADIIAIWLITPWLLPIRGLNINIYPKRVMTSQTIPVFLWDKLRYFQIKSWHVCYWVVWFTCKSKMFPPQSSLCYMTATL